MSRLHETVVMIARERSRREAPHDTRVAGPHAEGHPGRLRRRHDPRARRARGADGGLHGYPAPGLFSFGGAHLGADAAQKTNLNLIRWRRWRDRDVVVTIPGESTRLVNGIDPHRSRTSTSPRTRSFRMWWRSSTSTCTPRRRSPRRSSPTTSTRSSCASRGVLESRPKSEKRPPFIISRGGDAPRRLA